MIDLPAIRKAASEATPGPFHYARYDHGGGRMWTEKDGARNLVADFYELNDREYYIACDPAAVLAMVRVCEAARDLTPGNSTVLVVNELARVPYERMQALSDALRALTGGVD